MHTTDIHTATSAPLGTDRERVKTPYDPYCTAIEELVTAEEFE